MLFRNKPYWKSAQCEAQQFDKIQLTAVIRIRDLSQPFKVQKIIDLQI